MNDELPPSLRVKPNIPWSKQTLEQLEAERAYWQQMLNSMTGWGAAYAAAQNFFERCDSEIQRCVK